MLQPQHSVADVIREHAAAFLASRGARVSPAQRKVLHDLDVCRTAALGGHELECGCGRTINAYNSCRNRHCPTCLAHRSADWLEDRRRELLPVNYFHVVFTIPELLAQLALGNKRVLYDILFQATGETLNQLARDPRHLGARIGFLAVLHTWSQTLLHHPHLHCIVPGGGLSEDGTEWIGTRSGFFIHVRVLARLFRGKFLHLLRKARECDKLTYAGATAHLHDDGAFEDLLRSMYSREWVVYCKPPFGSPQQVLKYLASYTHRVAIANRRIVSMPDGRVTFRYRDRKKDCSKTMQLDANEFLRRFLLHVLPNGYTRIRHFGLFANGHRTKMLARCRDILGQPANADLPVLGDGDAEQDQDTAERSAMTCPSCGAKMVRGKPILAQPPESWSRHPDLGWDTS